EADPRSAAPPPDLVDRAAHVLDPACEAGILNVARRVPAAAIIEAQDREARSRKAGGELDEGAVGTDVLLAHGLAQHDGTVPRGRAGGRIVAAEQRAVGRAEIQRQPGRYTELRTHRLPFSGASPEEPEAAADSLDDVLLPGLATVPRRAQGIATGGELSNGLEVQLTRIDPHPERLFDPGNDLEREHGMSAEVVEVVVQVHVVDVEQLAPYRGDRLLGL